MARLTSIVAMATQFMPVHTLPVLTSTAWKASALGGGEVMTLESEKVLVTPTVVPSPRRVVQKSPAVWATVIVLAAEMK